MAHSGQGCKAPAGVATVRLRGVLDEAPQLSQGNSRVRSDGANAQFCEVPVRITDWRIPVRFEGSLALLVVGQLDGAEISLRGRLRRYEWDGAKGQPNERLVVLCTQIDRLRAPDNRIRVRTLDE
jgi:hypothetical protein